MDGFAVNVGHCARSCFRADSRKQLRAVLLPVLQTACAAIARMLSLALQWAFEQAMASDGREVLQPWVSQEAGLLADVQAAQEGDPQAFARLVRSHQQQIGAYMWRFTRDRAQWDELVQDVFVEAFFSLKTYRADSPFSHWLKRIATRTGYRFWRRRTKGRQRTDAAVDGMVEKKQQEVGDQLEAAELVHYLLAQLAPPARLVLTLHYVEQLSVAEIAELIGWSSSRVKVQMHRARRRLRTICDKRGIEL